MGGVHHWEESDKEALARSVGEELPKRLSPRLNYALEGGPTSLSSRRSKQGEGGEKGKEKENFRQQLRSAIVVEKEISPQPQQIG